MIDGVNECTSSAGLHRVLESDATFAAPRTCRDSDHRCRWPSSPSCRSRTRCTRPQRRTPYLLPEVHQPCVWERRSSHHNDGPHRRTPRHVACHRQPTRYRSPSCSRRAWTPRCAAAPRSGACTRESRRAASRPECAPSTRTRSTTRSRATRSALTAADLAAQAAVVDALGQAWPGLCIVDEEDLACDMESTGRVCSSETRRSPTPTAPLQRDLCDFVEAVPPESRAARLEDITVFVDLLDGTREFVEGRVWNVQTLVGIAVAAAPSPAQSGCRSQAAAKTRRRRWYTPSSAPGGPRARRVSRAVDRPGARRRRAR